MKQAYLIITDLHFSGHSKTNRYSYDKELYVVMHKIVDVILETKQTADEVFCVFLGDIFDKSYKSPEKYGVDSSFFYKLKGMTNGLFVVCGNHEINFYLNNPFWTLVSEIKSLRINSLQKVNTQPLGYENVFYVVDNIRLSGCVLHFNHYGCEDSPAIPGMKNIAFYHKPVFNMAMVDDAEIKGIPVDYARTVTRYSLDTVRKYDMVFLGHMHWLYSSWNYEGTEVHGLASLGRPSKAEVSNSFLERSIPVLFFDDGIFTKMEDNKFMLPSREESIIKEVDDEQRAHYEAQKRDKEAKAYISTTDNPIHNIRTFLSGEERLRILFDSIVDRTFSDKEIVERLFELDRRSRL